MLRRLRLLVSVLLKKQKLQVLKKLLSIVLVFNIMVV
ncbi:Uncharacterised protein [Neisseria dentiae]|nr:Uncharacterised protein [Neisseria dentiae]